LDSLLRFRPRQRSLKTVEGVEEPVGLWQRDLIKAILLRRDRTPIEAGDAARERVDEGIQLRVRKCPIESDARNTARRRTWRICGSGLSANVNSSGVTQGCASSSKVFVQEGTSIVFSASPAEVSQGHFTVSA